MKAVVGAMIFAISLFSGQAMADGPAQSEKIEVHIVQLTYFGNGGKASAETIATSVEVPPEICGTTNKYGFQFAARIGAPSQAPTNLSIQDFVNMTSALLAAYLNGAPIKITYVCEANQMPMITKVE